MTPYLATQTAACRVFDVTPEEVVGWTRRKPVVEARRWIVRTLRATDPAMWSYPTIAEELRGDRGRHSTVIEGQQAHALTIEARPLHAERTARELIRQLRIACDPMPLHARWRRRADALTVDALLGREGVACGCPTEHQAANGSLPQEPRGLR